MSRFDDMLDWATGYTRKVNARKALELKEREVKALERLAAKGNWKQSAPDKYSNTETIREKRKP